MLPQEWRIKWKRKWTMKWNLLHWGCIGFRDIAPRMENQMEKKMENEMETGGIEGFKELKLNIWGSPV